jgi:squalene-hopene/tetraprenyl-beta-curcumene cyclase
MPLPDRTVGSQLQAAIAKSQNYLFSMQQPDGHWVAELESNVTITAEIVLLHRIWGTDQTRPMAKAERYLRSQQRTHGGWELFYGDGGELSTTVEAYMALRLLGVPQDDPALLNAREFIMHRGGISQTRIFTKLHLALIGCYDWRGIPSIPPWVMFLQPPFPVSIYEMSSWARGSTVPLLIVFDRKPVFKVDPSITLDELYAEGIENARFELPLNHDWRDAFVYLDQAFKVAEALNWVPLREAGIDAAERWILERQEPTGDWGGIIPAMLNSLLALRCLHYDVNDPVIVRGLRAIDNFALETDDEYCVQACLSPVWDTALVMRALVASGIEPTHPALVRSGEWLLEKQILAYGDWAVKNRQGKPGGWAFEYDNCFYPDVDDTAVVVMALDAVTLPHETQKQAAIHRAVDWIASMQCHPGGWAAFDYNNDQDWLNAIPYGDLKAMIDPNTADVTARVLEMVGQLESSAGVEKGNRDEGTGRSFPLIPSPFPLPPSPPLPITHHSLNRAIRYLIDEQEPDGSWFGRWGVNYLYGTSGVLSALALVAPQRCRPQLERGAAWLVNCQNADGGWGETCRSYEDPQLKGKGASTASQTAWAIIGLLAVQQAGIPVSPTVIASGVQYLIKTQTEEGSWEEAEFTGTGFPGHFYIRYHLYRQHFPLMALGRYQSAIVA